MVETSTETELLKLKELSASKSELISEKYEKLKMLEKAHRDLYDKLIRLRDSAKADLARLEGAFEDKTTLQVKVNYLKNQKEELEKDLGLMSLLANSKDGCNSARLSTTSVSTEHALLSPRNNLWKSRSPSFKAAFLKAQPVSPTSKTAPSRSPSSKVASVVASGKVQSIFGSRSPSLTKPNSGKRFSDFHTHSPLVFGNLAKKPESQSNSLLNNRISLRNSSPLVRSIASSLLGPHISPHLPISRNSSFKNSFQALSKKVPDDTVSVNASESPMVAISLVEEYLKVELGELYQENNFLGNLNLFQIRNRTKQKQREGIVLKIFFVQLSID